ncbi:MAG: HzsA-related protein, partial [Planctomycetota bacterium]
KAGANNSIQELYKQARVVGRQAALQNPLIDFDEMLFVTKRGYVEGVLQCMNVGYGVGQGGGLYKVSGLLSDNPQITDILANSTVESGRMAGQTLSGQGAFNLADLDYDGQTIAFSHVAQSDLFLPWPDDTTQGFNEQTTFHLFKVNADGSGLVQLTDGNRNDYHPCFLPNGRIAFISDRRNVMDRCQGADASQPCGTLYSIKPDGSDMIPLSYHETTELLPSVDNDGMIVYTRWDYVDRDFSAAHHFWICYPDGRDPRAPHGNYPLPHSTLNGVEWEDWTDGRAERPWAEYAIRAIPGSNQYFAVAGLHHYDDKWPEFPDGGGPAGQLILINTAIPDDNKMSQVTRFQGCAMPDEGCGPEGFNTFHGDIDIGLPTDCPNYIDPWPLSEDYVIAAREKNVYLVDKFGNSEILFSASEAQCNGIGIIRKPMPLRARTRPPVIPTQTFQGERAHTPGHNKATIGIINVYLNDQPWPANATIKWIRVMQLIPYPWSSPYQDQPQIGPAQGSFARMVLGTVPVEDDGSAYFEAPVGVEIYFQALDENGMAVQSMRSGTYVHAGEQLTCLGCHEGRQAPPPGPMPTAFQRAPSPLVPNLEDGSCPLTFARLVEPVLTSSCNPCHQSSGIANPDLFNYQFYFHGSSDCSGLVPMHGGYRTIPGKFGALHTGIADILLDANHHPDNTELTMADINRITLWVDANSNELGAYHNVEEQRAGQVIWPVIDVDPANPSAVEPAGCKDPTDPKFDPLAQVHDPWACQNPQVPVRSPLNSQGELVISLVPGLVRIILPTREKYRIDIINISGKRILSRDFTGTRLITLSTAALPAGIYLLRATSGRVMKEGKFAMVR